MLGLIDDVTNYITYEKINSLCDGAAGGTQRFRRQTPA